MTDDVYPAPEALRANVYVLFPDNYTVEPNTNKHDFSIPLSVIIAANFAHLFRTVNGVL